MGWGGATNNWNDCANWSGDVCLGSSDVATFDTSSIKNATINVDINVAGVEVKSGYTGVISAVPGVIVSIGSSGFVQADGTIDFGASATTTISGNFTFRNGIFTASNATTTFQGDFIATTTTYTFNHNNGTAYFNITSNRTIDVNTSITFNNFTLEAPYEYRLYMGSGDTVIVQGTTILINGVLYSGTLFARGNVDIRATFDGGGGTIKFEGSVNQLLYDYGGIKPPLMF